jgi:hypothetical protein
MAYSRANFTFYLISVVVPAADVRGVGVFGTDRCSSAMKQVPALYTAHPFFLFLSPLSYPASFVLQELDFILLLVRVNIESKHSP